MFISTKGLRILCDFVVGVREIKREREQDCCLVKLFEGDNLFEGYSK